MTNSIPTRTCTTCRRELPATEETFGLQRDSKSGKYRLRAACRECRARHERERHYRKKGRRPEVLPAGVKRCSVCLEVKPADADHFPVENGQVRNPCLPCRRAKNRESYYRHAEARKLKALKWARANPEKVREYLTKHHALHGDRRREWSRRWARAHKEQRREYDVKRRATPRGNALHRAKEARRRARKRAAPGDHNADDVQAKYALQAGRCYWCGKRVRFGDHDVDHIVPLARGGGNGSDNICISCPSCNRRKGAKTPLEFSGRLF